MARVEGEASSLWREARRRFEKLHLNKSQELQIRTAEKEKDQCNGAGVSL